jgi:hypothetical protein
MAEDAKPSNPVHLNGAGTLTTDERLQASSLAASFVLQIQALKAPLRRLVLEEVRRFLGDES